MSVVLDALRRKPTRGTATADRASRGAAVLGALGGTRESGKQRRTRRLAIYGAVSALLGFLGVGGVILLLTRSTSGPAGGAPATPDVAVKDPGGAAPAAQSQVQTASEPPALSPALPPALPETESATPAPRADASDVSGTRAQSETTPPAQGRRRDPKGEVAGGNAEAAASTRPQGRPALGPPATTPEVPSVPDGALSGAPPALVPATGDRFGLAVHYQKAGDLDRALAEYQSLLRDNDERADVHNNIGLIFQARGDDAQATSHFSRAVALAPRYVKAHNNLGVALLRAGRPDAATAELRAALSLDPRNVESLVNLALVFRAQGRPADAKDLLRQALGINPRNAGAHYNLGLVAEEAGDANLAITHYQSFLRLGGLTDPELAGKVRTKLVDLGGA